MQVRSILTTIALATSVLLAAPLVGALDIGCQRADESGVAEVTALPAGSTTLFTPKGADVLGWTPECVIIPNGGTVIFTQRDAIGHGAIRTGCFELGVMSATARAQTSLAIDFQPGLGFALTQENGAEGECADLVVEDERVVIDYWCSIHGTGMPGRIIVEI